MDGFVFYTGIRKEIKKPPLKRWWTELHRVIGRRLEQRHVFQDDMDRDDFLGRAPGERLAESGKLKLRDKRLL